MVDYALAAAYQKALSRLSDAASSAALSKLTKDAPAVITDEDMALLRVIDEEVAQSAATLAANVCTETYYLNGLSLTAGIPESAVTFAGVDASQILAGGASRDKVVRALAEVVSRAPQRAARTTVLAAVAKVPKMRFARILSGPGACEWCTMLASRGAVYLSHESAAAGAHHNCRCAILPGLHGDDVSDGRYYALWRSAQAADAKVYKDDAGNVLTGRALRDAKTQERTQAWTDLRL